MPPPMPIFTPRRDGLPFAPRRCRHATRLRCRDADDLLRHAPRRFYCGRYLFAAADARSPLLCRNAIAPPPPRPERRDAAMARRRAMPMMPTLMPRSAAPIARCRSGAPRRRRAYEAAMPPPASPFSRAHFIFAPPPAAATTRLPSMFARRRSPRHAALMIAFSFHDAADAVLIFHMPCPGFACSPPPDALAVICCARHAPQILCCRATARCRLRFDAAAMPPRRCFTRAASGRADARPIIFDAADFSPPPPLPRRDGYFFADMPAAPCFFIVFVRDAEPIVLRYATMMRLRHGAAVSGASVYARHVARAAAHYRSLPRLRRCAA